MQIPGYSNSFMPISDYAKKMYGPNIASSSSPPAPAPQSTLPAGSMTQRGNNLFGLDNQLMGTMQGNKFTPGLSNVDQMLMGGMQQEANMGMKSSFGQNSPTGPLSMDPRFGGPARTSNMPIPGQYNKGPRMNDEFGMMSPEEIQRRVDEKKARQKNQYNYSFNMADSVEQRGNSIYGPGNKFLGTMQGNTMMVGPR